MDWLSRPMRRRFTWPIPVQRMSPGFRRQSGPMAWTGIRSDPAPCLLPAPRDCSMDFVVTSMETYGRPHVATCFAIRLMERISAQSPLERSSRMSASEDSTAIDCISADRRRFTRSISIRGAQFAARRRRRRRVAAYFESGSSTFVHVLSGSNDVMLLTRAAVSSPRSF
jgi:hypothetical protein